MYIPTLNIYNLKGVILLRLLSFILITLSLISCEESQLPNPATVEQKTVDPISAVDTIINYDTIIDTVFIIDTVLNDTISDDAFEPDNTFLSACTVSLNSVNYRYLRPNDCDWFTFYLEAGEAYDFALANLEHEQNGYIYAELYDESGYNEVPTSFIGFNDVRIGKYIAENSGYYFLKIRGNTDSRDAYGFRLRSIKTVGEDQYEPNNSLFSATPMELQGVNYYHTLSHNDSDYISFTADSGVAYEIEALWEDQYARTRREVTLWNSTDTYYLDHYYSSYNSSISLKLLCEKSGDYYLRVAPMDLSESKYSISYRTISQGIADEYEPDNSIETATVHPSINDTTTHTLTVNDTDYIRFEASAGQYHTASIITEDRNINSFVYDEFGEHITAHVLQGGPKGTEMSFLLENSGYYYIKLFQSLNDTASYQITIDTLDGGELDSYEPNNSDSSATPLEVGGEVQSHTISLFDIDYFIFDVDSGVQYELLFSDVTERLWLQRNYDYWHISSSDSETSHTFVAESSVSIVVRISALSSEDLADYDIKLQKK